MIKRYYNVFKVCLCTFLSCTSLYANMTELELNAEFTPSRLGKIDVMQTEKMPQHISSSAMGIIILKENLFVPLKLGDISVTYEGNEFYIQKNASEKLQIPRWNLSKELRGIEDKQLQGFLDIGYLSVNQLDDNDFTLNAHVRGPGGTQVRVRIKTVTLSFGGAGVAGLVRGLMKENKLVGESGKSGWIIGESGGGGILIGGNGGSGWFFPGRGGKGLIKNGEDGYSLFR